MDRKKISNSFSGPKHAQKVQKDVLCIVTLAVVFFCGMGALYIRSFSEALRQQDLRSKTALRTSTAIVEQDNSSHVSLLPEQLTLRSKLGDIKIVLRPDLSLESVEYIKALLESPDPCPRCRFYRAEKPGIIQGMLAKNGTPPNTVLGKCPEEFKDVPRHDCPKHDPNCGCHGPLMHRGMVGWAAGKLN